MIKNSTKIFKYFRLASNFSRHFVADKIVADKIIADNIDRINVGRMISTTLVQTIITFLSRIASTGPPHIM
jgi:hypothetical protein